MTTLVLVILGGIWAAVIIVPLIRRNEGTLGDSIGTFRRHLSVLERAAPTSVNPANRLRLPVSPMAIPPYRPPTAAGATRTRQAPYAGAPTRRPEGPYASSSGVHRRRQAQKRRRDVLFALTIGIAASFLLSMVQGLHMMWFVTVGLVFLLAAYVLLLIRMRNLAAEREMKLTFLPSPQPVRSYSARPSARSGYARAAGYGDGAEYGLPAGY